MTNQTSDNKFGVSPWIVDPVVGLGTHTTISAALGDASSGETIFIRPGVYTQPLTLKAGVNLVAFEGDSSINLVNITGKVSASFSGSASLSNLTFTTNGDFALEVSGSNATRLFIVNSNFQCADNTGISFTSSNASSLLDITACSGDISTTGIAIFSHSSAGILNFEECNFDNTGDSTTANTASAGELFINWTQFINPITTSGTVSMGCNWSSFFLRTNTTFFTLGSSGAQQIKYSTVTSGTQPAFSISTTLEAVDVNINSTNANIITGTGNLDYSNISRTTLTTGVINISGTLSGNGACFNAISFDGGTQELDFYSTGSWTPSIEFGGGTTGITYTTQVGSYTRIGKLVHAQCEILLSAKGTDTGAATIAGLPYAASGDSVGTTTWGTIDLDVAGGYYYLSANLADSAQVLTLQENGDNIAIAALTDVDFSNTSSITVSIQYMVA